MKELNKRMQWNHIYTRERMLIQVLHLNNNTSYFFSNESR